MNADAAGTLAGSRGLSYVSSTRAPLTTADCSTGAPVAAALRACANAAAGLPAASWIGLAPGAYDTAKAVPAAASRSSVSATAVPSTATSRTVTAAPPTRTVKSPAAGTEAASSASSKYSAILDSAGVSPVCATPPPSSFGATASVTVWIRKRSNEQHRGARWGADLLQEPGGGLRVGHGGQIAGAHRRGQRHRDVPPL